MCLAETPYKIMHRICHTLPLPVVLLIAISIPHAHAADGDFVWAKVMGGSASNIGRSISIDSSGNVYTTGDFSGTADFDPGAGTYNLTVAGINDIFISKLDGSGEFAWAKSMGGTAGDSGYGIDVDSSGNVYATGYFEGTADFDPGPATYNLSSKGGRDIFVSKLDSKGDLVWAKAMGSTSSDEGYGVSVDSSGNVYTTGHFFGTVDFDPGPGIYNLTSKGSNDIFISKLDSNGDFVWARNMGGISSDYGYGISVDVFGNAHTTGYFSGIVDFDPGVGVYNLSSKGSNDIFISKLDSNGDFVWAKSMGGILNNGGYGISTDSSGNVYTTGYFNGTCDFDPGAGTYNLTSEGDKDIFVSKLNSNGDFVWANAMGGTLSDQGYCISNDSSGNVYATGSFQDTSDFDPGAGTSTLTSEGNSDIFISKLDGSGNLVWASSMGGPTKDTGYGISVDSSGNVYTVGWFNGTVDFDPGAGTHNLTSSDFDIFTCKLSGIFAWPMFLPAITNSAEN